MRADPGPVRRLLSRGVNVLAFTRAHGRSWTLALALGLATLAVVQVGFVWLMGVPLPRPLLGAE